MDFAVSYQQLADHIDQLDLALDQLAFRDRNFTRFAFMLVDNVAELALHSYVERTASEVPRPLDDAMQKALGSYFPEKIKFAKKRGYINEDEAETIRALHEFRNAVYHQGQRHEGILHSLSLLYIRTLSLVLGRDSVYPISNGRDQVSHRAIKYIGSSIHRTNVRERFRLAWVRLGDVCRAIPHDVVADLAKNMDELIAEAEDALDYLLSCEGKGLGRDDIVRKWLPKDPVPSWKRRAASLRKEKSEHLALKKYCSFREQNEDHIRDMRLAAEAAFRHEELNWELRQEDVDDEEDE